MDKLESNSQTRSSMDLVSSKNENQAEMDSLLVKLRKGMTELSVQGDDFTQQMWSMYSTFKDLKAGSVKDKYSDKENKSKREIDFQNFFKSKVEDQLGQQKLLNSSFSINKNTDSIKAVQDKPITKSRKLIANKCGYQSDSCSSSSLTNPLLDTISSLTLNDPYSDSDDYDVSRKVYYQRHRRNCGRMLRNRAIRCLPNHPFSSSDAESIVYAGSNSIDSGYKSLCPTPEVPDSNSKLKVLEVVEKGSIECRKINFAKQKSVKSLINQCEDKDNLMSNNESYSDSLSRLNDSNNSLYNAKMCIRQKMNEKEAHLEHLKCVRQSLINAIQKCKQADSIVSPIRVASPVLSSLSSSTASTVISKVVNTDTGDHTSTSSSTFNTILASPGSLITKPILKDSFCASLRSQIESGQFCSDYSLESEIDSLLYGPRKTNTTCSDLNVDHLVDIPYVAMIENKYRKNQNHSSNIKFKETGVVNSKVSIENDNMNRTRVAQLSVPKEKCRRSFSLDAKFRKYSKLKIGEVTKNVLKMLEDIQNKHLREDKVCKKSTNFDIKAQKKIHLSPSFDNCLEMKNLPNSSDQKDVSYTLPEYHIYEEVMYDCLGDNLIDPPMIENKDLSLYKLEPSLAINKWRDSKLCHSPEFYKRFNRPMIRNSFQYRSWNDVNRCNWSAPKMI